MSCTQLTRVGRYLMMAGVNPVSHQVIATAAHNRLILALMMMCGHYDASANFAIKVGLPGKSGVGGGILAIAPGVASVAVWSPGLCAAGNSLLGTYALERLVQMTGWTVFSQAVTRYSLGVFFHAGCGADRPAIRPSRSVTMTSTAMSDGARQARVTAAASAAIKSPRAG